MILPYLKEALKKLFSAPDTRMYPAVEAPAPEGYRGRIVYYPERCINCGLCSRVCAPQAITRTIEPAEGGSNITLEFHMGSCTFCRMCADFCSKHAIELTQDYHIVVTDEDDLKVRGTFFKPAPVKPAKPEQPK